MRNKILVFILLLFCCSLPQNILAVLDEEGGDANGLGEEIVPAQDFEEEQELVARALYDIFTFVGVTRGVRWTLSTTKTSYKIFRKKWFHFRAHNNSGLYTVIQAGQTAGSLLATYLLYQNAQKYKNTSLGTRDVNIGNDFCEFPEYSYPNQTFLDFTMISSLAWPIKLFFRKMGVAAENAKASKKNLLERNNQGAEDHRILLMEEGNMAAPYEYGSIQYDLDKKLVIVFFAGLGVVAGNFIGAELNTPSTFHNIHCEMLSNFAQAKHPLIGDSFLIFLSVQTFYFIMSLLTAF